MTNFVAGDLITINSPNHPGWHGKKGMIKSQTPDGFIAAIVTETGKETLLELMPHQILKIVRDPAMEKFMSAGFKKLDLTKHDVMQDDSDDDTKEIFVDQETVDQIDREVRLCTTAATEGYMRGFTEGYLQGYRDACDSYNQILREHGIIPPKQEE